MLSRCNCIGISITYVQYCNPSTQVTSLSGHMHWYQHYSIETPLHRSPLYQDTCIGISITYVQYCNPSTQVTSLSGHMHWYQHYSIETPLHRSPLIRTHALVSALHMYSIVTPLHRSPLYQDTCIGISITYVQYCNPSTQVTSLSGHMHWYQHYICTVL